LLNSVLPTQQFYNFLIPQFNKIGDISYTNHMRKILFIGGSLNQTRMMHKISKHLQNYDCYFTPYYATSLLGALANLGLADFSVLGGVHKKLTLEYFEKNNLMLDMKGNNNFYDLVFTCSDLIVPRNIRNKKIVLVQEGMTDPINIRYYMAKYLGLPKWIASTSTTGLSNRYDYFCVASNGYKKFFIRNGVDPNKIEVTGLPNFDNLQTHFNNNFPYKDFVLVATSDSRETFKLENRKKFILDSKKIAGNMQLIFKLHPNENHKRAKEEIEKYAPCSLVYTDGDINNMIANCNTLITRFSTVVYVGIILGKKVHSYFDIDKLREMSPIQNNGSSSFNIAQIGINLLEGKANEKLPEKHFLNILQPQN